MKKDLTTTILTIIVGAVIILSMFSCSPKYGCPATAGKVGYHPYKN